MAGATKTAAQLEAERRAAAAAGASATQEQVNAVEAGFNAFAKANKKMEGAYAQLSGSLSPNERENLNAYLLAIRTGEDQRPKYSSLAPASDPKYAEVVAAARENKEAKKQFAGAREAMGASESNTNSLISQVEARSKQGQATTTSDVSIRDKDGETKPFSAILAGQRGAGAPVVAAPATPAAPAAPAASGEAEKAAYLQAEKALQAAVRPKVKNGEFTPAEKATYDAAEKQFIAARKATLSANGLPAEDEKKVKAAIASEHTVVAQQVAGERRQGPQATPAAPPVVEASDDHKVRSGEVLSRIADSPKMKAARAAAREALSVNGHKATNREILELVTAVVARESDIVNVNQLKVDDVIQVSKVTPDKIKAALEELRIAGKVNEKGQLALGSTTGSVAEIFAAAPAATPSAAGSVAPRLRS